MNKLDSKVLVDPPMEEYPEVIFRKANSDSDREDVLRQHPEPKAEQANFDFDMGSAPVE